MYIDRLDVRLSRASAWPYMLLLRRVESCEGRRVLNRFGGLDPWSCFFKPTEVVLGGYSARRAISSPASSVYIGGGRGYLECLLWSLSGPWKRDRIELTHLGWLSVPVLYSSCLFNLLPDNEVMAATRMRFARNR